MRRRRAHITSPRNQAGLSLLEVLIALVVLSVGLLGLANLQAVGLRAHHAAYLRSQASFMVYDMVDRMRANRPPALAGDYDIALGTAAPSGTAVPAADLAEWKTQLLTLLPAGDGAVDVEGEIATVIVQWDESRGAEAPARFAVTTRL